MADPSQGTTTAAPTAAQLATQGVAPSAPTVAPGATIEGSHEAHVESTLAGNLSKTSDGQPKTTGVEHAPQAPSPSPPSPPSRSSSSGHETIAPLKSNTSESIDEKVVERMQAQKIKEEAHGAEEDGEGGADGEGEGKGSKKKKGKPFFDKRTPLEIALEDPELAHLSPEYRKVVAEQMCVVSSPSVAVVSSR